MPTDEQRKLIEEVLADRQEAIAAALIEEAETLVPVAVQSTLGELRRMVADKFTRQIVDGIAKEQVAAYRAQVAKGGTDIIERVVTALGDGRVSITTRRTFKPWLSDMASRDQEEILRIIGEGQRDGMHPHQNARELRGYIDGTEHNAVTAARTEAQKIRTDARVATYLKTGVHYLEYIAVGDERTRPEHAARDGKIYPIDKAPWLGEPNCRCTLIDADYKVEEEAAAVEESDSITLTPEELEV
jgi:SPP1 gp7 family putative phage head morphogenesis protein